MTKTRHARNAPSAAARLAWGAASGSFVEMGTADSPYTCLAHADWSIRPQGRWMAMACREGLEWRVSAARMIAEPARLLPEIASAASDGPALLGVDLPVGAPGAWAAQAGVASFPGLLDALGDGRWSDFWRPAVTADEISLTRPFYPRGVGGKKQAQLYRALGFDRMAALRRECEWTAGGKGSGTPLFWTLGPAQVGKAALHFWEHVLQPARRAGSVAIWPFDGDLDAIAAPGRVAVAETYPGEIYGWLGLGIGGRGRRKGRVADRADDAGALLAAGARLGAMFDDDARAQIEAGFAGEGDDAFDAMVGLLGMLEVVVGGRDPGAPRTQAVRSVEGWILGRIPRNTDPDSNAVE